MEASAHVIGRTAIRIRCETRRRRIRISERKRGWRREDRPEFRVNRLSYVFRRKLVSNSYAPGPTYPGDEIRSAKPNPNARGARYSDRCAAIGYRNGFALLRRTTKNSGKET
jgi:hypothetical protein